jgi:multiple sugar transport system permease protein
MSTLAQPQVDTATPEQASAPGGGRRRSGAAYLSGGILVLVCIAMLSPVLWTAMAVTKSTDIAFLNPPVFFYRPTFTSFIDLWQTTLFYQYLINTLVVAVLSTVAALVIGIPAAYALSRYPGWLSAVLLIAALIFRALPRFAVVLPMYDLSRALGIYDTTFAVAAALVAINQPFSIWLLRNFFAEIPKELDEAAMIDGCSRFTTLRRVMVPLMGPGILTAGIFVFLFAFQEYLTATILTDVNARTVPVFIATQLGQTLPMLQQAGAAAM